MTAKRDLKKRVRERQAKTGESYVTARRHVVGAAAAKPRAIDVIELVDITDRATELGLRCTVRITPQLDELGCEVVLARLRDVLVGTVGDPATRLVRRVALEGAEPPRRIRTSAESIRRFLQRAHAGLGGTSDDGTLLAFPIAVDGELRQVLCVVRHDRSLSLMTIDEQALERRLLAAVEPRLVYLVYEGRRYPIAAELTIGRAPGCDLQIRDGNVSRRHATVLRRGDAFYIKDLGSLAGLRYRGVTIENKRIEEGDAFQIAEYTLAFTFIAND
ncbi:MAG TPA: FHA domain-containing protein [Kofleriaceae bacterium]|nr:FHA domain-containing protein [Kofleriaceae bacterium]